MGKDENNFIFGGWQSGEIQQGVTQSLYRKDSIKRPGGYLTFINIWGGAKSRGALNQGGRLFHRKGI